MKLLIFLVSAICILSDPAHGQPIAIDTSRFTLQFSESRCWLQDKLEKDSIDVDINFFILQDNELEDEKAYVSSTNYSTKTNSFEIGNGLVGIQIVSYDFMKEGSAQAGAGRDLFVIYNPAKKNIYDKILEFGITKQRHRYIGCLFAKTSHFILADIDHNGLLDIGRIKEELKCDESYQTYFVQDSVEWHTFVDNDWNPGAANNLPDDYKDLPLINLKMNPIDVFGFNKWQSFDPKDWQRKTEVHYYPAYRLGLIKEEKERSSY